MNEKRMSNKSIPLNEPQKAAILSCFDTNGDLFRFCKSHLLNYANISERTFFYFKAKAKASFTQRFYEVFEMNKRNLRQKGQKK